MDGTADMLWPDWGDDTRREIVSYWIAEGLYAGRRLLLPVILLLVSFAAIYLYLDTPAALVVGAADAQWLSVGHLLLPLSFLCVHMTNRRYGPAFAFAQVVLAFALAIAFVMFAVPALADVAPLRIVPEMRVAVAFGAAFFIASFLSIVVFDGARGPRWWVAPLIGMLSSVVLFCLIFYPAAYAGVAPWSHRMLQHMELLAGAAVLMLLPYWTLRGIVRPLPGYGGY